MKWLWWLFGALIALGLIGYGIYATTKHGANSSPAPASQAARRGGSDRTVPSGSLEYRTAQYHFSLLYPDTLAPHTYGETGGGSTIAFAGAKDTRAFQIFVTPYSGATVSADR